MKQIHPKAYVHETAKIGANVVIGPFANVHKNAVIGDNTVIEAHVVIEEAASVGKHCHLFSFCHVSYQCEIHDHVTIYPFACIGSPGFGYASDREGKHHYIPQIGTQVVGENAKIGPHACLDRAALSKSIVGKDTQLGAYTHLAHNVEIGEGSRAYVELVVAGSTKIGKGFYADSRVSVTGHKKLGDKIHMRSHTGVNNSETSSGTFQGFPHEPEEKFHERMQVLKQIHQILQIAEKAEK
tara:strand:+ start:1112 stop:1831 length:720 start_codon:yes stop_codon:yes gene_type:complete